MLQVISQTFVFFNPTTLSVKEPGSWCKWALSQTCKRCPMGDEADGTSKYWSMLPLVASLFTVLFSNAMCVCVYVCVVLLRTNCSILLLYSVITEKSWSCVSFLFIWQSWFYLFDKINHSLTILFSLLLQQHTSSLGRIRSRLPAGRRIPRSRVLAAPSPPWQSS